MAATIPDAPNSSQQSMLDKLTKLNGADFDKQYRQDQYSAHKDAVSAFQRYAKSGDIRIAYQVIGNGPLDLVFVPGFISNLDAHWEDPGFSHGQRLAKSTSTRSGAGTWSHT